MVLISLVLFCCSPAIKLVSKIDSLDTFVQEILHLCPMAPTAITRQSTEGFHIGSIGVVPAGTLITADMYHLYTM